MSNMLSAELRQILETNVHPLPAKQYLESQLCYDRFLAAARRRHQGLRLNIDHYQRSYADIDHMSILKEQMEKLRSEGFVVNLVHWSTTKNMEVQEAAESETIFLDIDWENAVFGPAGVVFDRMWYPWN